MSIISLIEASKDFGTCNLFQNLTLHINKKERLGLIGPNGSGKSTLLKMIAGKEELDQGKRQCSSRLSLEFVDQESKFSPGKTVIEEVLGGCGNKKDLLIEFSTLSSKIAKDPSNNSLLERLSRVSEEMDSAQVWSLENQCKEILERLGIQDFEQPVENLSGGYRKRVNLASALVSNPDLLLLDEPTNHLDAYAVEWLQNWLKRYNGALVIITHDRYVLDKVTNNIIEISKGKITNFKGNYNSFLNLKIKQEIEESKSIRRLKNILKKELAWLNKGAKARSAKQKARIQRIEKMRSNSLNENSASLTISSNFKRTGKKIIEIKGVSISQMKNGKEFDLIKDFSYSFEKQDRVGIIGPNGSGKSTLLNLISGNIKPSRGIVDIGETIEFGYLDQHTADLSLKDGLERKVIDYVEEIASYIQTEEGKISASQLLERFLFTPAEQHSLLKKISGGEKRRLTLCRNLIKAPNCLLLDEPTNDLDIQTLGVLEDFLDKFQGCVVIVSHDRYFLDRTVNRIFSFNKGCIERHEGNYSSFIEKTEHLKDKVIRSNTESLINKKSIVKGEKLINVNTKVKTTRLTYKETKELKELEQLLPILESEKTELEASFSKREVDLTKASNELAELMEKIRIKEERWLELSELSA